MSLNRVLVLLLATVGGLTFAKIAHFEHAYRTPGYLTVILFLLVIGLYGSTSGIGLGELRANLKLVVLAITLGVLLKVVLIAGAMWWIFTKPEYMVLGVAVAQIDPLSVAALRDDSRMSDSAKSILSAWAAFDDPVTVLLTIAVSGYVLDNPAISAGFGSFLGSLLANAALVVVVLVLWGLFSDIRRKRVTAFLRRRAPVPVSRKPPPVGKVVAAGVLVVAGVALAVWLSLMFAVALVGLFLRLPERFTWLVDRAVLGALVAATFALGVVLANGIALWPGVVLGLLAFGAQVVVGFLLTVGHPGRDRVSLALSQQNGITAIVLALVLEPALPEAVGTVAPAIVTVNLLHHMTNLRPGTYSWPARMATRTAASFTRAPRSSRVLRNSSNRTDRVTDPAAGAAAINGSTLRSGKTSITRS